MATCQMSRSKLSARFAVLNDLQIVRREGLRLIVLSANHYQKTIQIAPA